MVGRQKSNTISLFLLCFWYHQMIFTELALRTIQSISCDVRHNVFPRLETLLSVGLESSGQRAYRKYWPTCRRFWVFAVSMNFTVWIFWVLGSLSLYMLWTVYREKEIVCFQLIELDQYWGFINNKAYWQCILLVIIEAQFKLNIRYQHY